MVQFRMLGGTYDKTQKNKRKNGPKHHAHSPLALEANQSGCRNEAAFDGADGGTGSGYVLLRKPLRTRPRNIYGLSNWQVGMGTCPQGIGDRRTGTEARKEMRGGITAERLGP